MSIMSPDYAVYTPAVNSLYVDTIASTLPNDRQFPDDLTLDDFAFWLESSKLWYHEHFLHSIGQYKVGKQFNNAVTQRGSTDGVLIGDSGGYQIGKGKLVGLDDLVGLVTGMSGEDACAAWRSAYDARKWILTWLETYTNYAMTLDMPLWATGNLGKSSPFHKCTHEQLTEMTVENLQFIDSHRQGRTKWLNVIQGLDAEGMIKWWKAVQWFDGAGYACTSVIGKTHGLRAVLEPLLTMRDDDAFKKGRDWVHFLGVSTTPWAVMYTAIQQAIRSNINPALRISYDSASPIRLASVNEQYNTMPAFSIDESGWGIGKVQTPHSRTLVGSQEPAPFNSPLGDRLTLGDLNFREGNKYTRRQFDTLSLLYLINHNMWVYLTAFQSANDLAFSGDRSQIPPKYKACIDVIGEAFKVDDWQSLLSKEQVLLDSFTG